MTSMVERVAREFYETNPIADDWNKLGTVEKGYWMACARAAIAAMREPTEEMRTAFRNAIIEECAQAAQGAILKGLLGRSIVATIRALKSDASR